MGKKRKKPGVDDGSGWSQLLKDLSTLTGGTGGF
jgi:hypothetical protein